jgi:hypothetical protein
MRDGLTPLEAEALRRCFASEPSADVRAMLLTQLDAATLSRTPDRACGYYLDFDVPSHRRDQGADPFVLECAATHPDRQNAIFFLLYVVYGVLEFLELSSTGDWPEDESAIMFDAVEAD